MPLPSYVLGFEFQVYPAKVNDVTGAGLMSRDQFFPDGLRSRRQKQFPFSFCLEMCSEEAVFASSTFYWGSGYRGTKGDALGLSQ